MGDYIRCECTYVKCPTKASDGQCKVVILSIADNCISCSLYCEEIDND